MEGHGRAVRKRRAWTGGSRNAAGLEDLDQSFFSPKRSSFSAGVTPISGIIEVGS